MTPSKPEPVSTRLCSHSPCAEADSDQGTPVTAQLRAAARDSEAWQAAEKAEWAARQAQILQQAEEAQRAKRQAKADAEEQQRLQVGCFCCCYELCNRSLRATASWLHAQRRNSCLQKSLQSALHTS